MPPHPLLFYKPGHPGPGSEEYFIFYVKNVPPIEPIIRVLMGIGLLVAAVMWLGVNAQGVIVGVRGMLAAVTWPAGDGGVCALAVAASATASATAISL